MSERRRPVWLLVAVPCAALLLWRAWQERWVTDDALITFRYVENLAEGYGLVYNPGERVEGFSNPLFVLLLWPFAVAGADLFAASQWLGLVASGAEALLVVWVAHRATRSPLLAGLAGLIFATDRVAVVWATGGLETSVHGLLLFAAFALAVRLPADARGRPLALATLLHLLVALSRPEGAAFYVLFVAVLSARSLRAGHGVRPALRSLPWFAGPYAAFVVGRLLYYGKPLANTFYAKVGGIPTLDLGLVYLAGFAERLGLAHPLHALPWLALAALVAWSLLRTRGRVREGAPALLPTLGTGAAYFGFALALVVLMGGDYMTDFRMLRPVIGVLAVTIACAIAVVASSGLPRREYWAGALAAALLVSHLVRQREGSPVAWDAPPAEQHKDILSVDRERARDFREALEVVAREGDSLVVDLAGFRGYGHRYRTYDATGLLSERPAEDFYLRDDWNEETGGRERLPGHARWPKVDYLEREGVTFIFPKVQSRGPDVPEITERSPRRHRGYPFLHVVAPIEEGRHLRFFTTLDREALRARAEEVGMTLCWRERGGPLECATPTRWP